MLGWKTQSVQQDCQKTTEVNGIITTNTRLFNVLDNLNTNTIHVYKTKQGSTQSR